MPIIVHCVAKRKHYTCNFRTICHRIIMWIGCNGIPANGALSHISRHSSTPTNNAVVCSEQLFGPVSVNSSATLQCASRPKYSFNHTCTASWWHPALSSNSLGHWCRVSNDTVEQIAFIAAIMNANVSFVTCTAAPESIFDSAAKHDAKRVPHTSSATNFLPHVVVFIISL